MLRIASFLLPLLLTPFPMLAQISASPGDPPIESVVVLPSSLESPSGFDALVAPEEFDTPELTVISVSGLSFFPSDSTIPWSWAAILGGGKYVVGSSDFMQAGLQLPHRAEVRAIELEACDTSDTGSVRLNFFKCVLPPRSCELVASVETGAAETPGCGTFFLALPTPHTVDNLRNSYIFDTRTTSGTDATRIRAARLGYRTPGRVLRPRE